MKLITTLSEDFEEFNTSVEKVTTSDVEIAKELELKVEPENVTELVYIMTKLEWKRSCFIQMNNDNKKWFLELGSTSSEDAVKLLK